MAYKILIADDDEDILEILELYLEKDGFEVVKAINGQKALEIIEKGKMDMAIIDVMMPIIDGFKLIKKIREEYNLPVIILSAKNQDTDKILGLGLGADDYIVKPFNPLEVVARVEAQLRRFYNLNSDNKTVQKIIKIGEIELDTFSNTLKKRDNEVMLTSVEYKIIKLLMENGGRVFTKKEIFETVWEDYFMGDDNTIMVHISNLREKIEDDSRKPIYLKTVRGLGYKFEKKVISNEE
ncbi:response regulator transcription factor [uncultured Clostridium sp.]|uniref:response regulator transcription factor n=1 Tax=uncultured Clostridium sp. TaxID=59620 RepID=UPI0025836A63|nr:response regulator transcription factor [uncultured Clostridium sp.]MDU1348404.1 response regulator transcription factor [Clostridium argentinense]